MNVLEKLADPFMGFLFPPICFLCDTLMENADDKVCPKCWSGFEKISETHRVWNELRGRLNSAGNVGAFNSLFLFQTEGPLQSAIHYFKYRGVKTIGTRFGAELGNRILNDAFLGQCDMIVPVPLHRLKQRERGFNQAESIAKGISEVTKLPVKTDPLQRTKYTGSQTRLDIDERKLNVAGAFAIRKGMESEISGRTILLIDDVITTGATINECASVLLAAGADSVHAASIALAE